jgi:hypothetical protein
MDSVKGYQFFLINLEKGTLIPQGLFSRQEFTDFLNHGFFFSDGFFCQIQAELYQAVSQKILWHSDGRLIGRCFIFDGYISLSPCNTLVLNPYRRDFGANSIGRILDFNWNPCWL